MLDPGNYLLIGLAAIAAGMVNALAGGGTLITFPMLTMVGVPAVVANVTNTVALCPGYLGATLAQWNEIRAQKKRAILYLPASIFGGIAGALLLLNTGERLFRSVVPFLILAAALLLAVSDPLRNWVLRRAAGVGADVSKMEIWGVLPVALAAVYGGYFGAGLSVIVLAVLGLVLSDSLTKLNALKQSVSLVVNVAAAVFFVFSGKVNWPAAGVMAVCALLGGVLGGKLAGKIKPVVLRWMVVSIGVIVGVIYLIRG
ncbi:sulfite exporter TauE/SafE family protein [Longilinea arvoryzae]|uniref:sulfite exporter TauE/SafE family protein n=1 Tax=Longilinea arvoryzae TaxID=360412 RepID=UPI0009467563